MDESLMTTSSNLIEQVTLTGNEYLLVYNVFSLVVASMFAAFVYFLMNSSQVAKQYRNAVVVSPGRIARFEVARVAHSEHADVPRDAARHHRCARGHCFDNDVGAAFHRRRVDEDVGAADGDASKPVGKGTGLGLSICKGIIEAHGGRIWAENVHDGLVFNFIVPLMWEGMPPQQLPMDTEIE